MARKVEEGIILGRPKGRKTSPEKHKLFGMDEIIYEYLLIGISQRKIAKLLQVDRNTLNRFIKRSSIINELKISVKKRAIL